MSDFLIAFLATVSATAWSYSKAHRRNGGNTQNASIVAAVVGVTVFIVMITLLNIIGNQLQD